MVTTLLWFGLPALLAVALIGSRTARRFLFTSLVLSGAFLGILLDRVRGKQGGPARLRSAFETLGPTYVKLAQLVASSEGMFPDAYCLEFRKCLDRVPSFPLEDVKATLRDELQREPAEVFSKLEEKPLASASIAQVHGATLHDGTDVVIKVQRPGLPRIVDADLRVLRVFAWVFEKLPLGDMANPRMVVEDFAANLADELDFRREAKNLDQFNTIMARHNLDGVAAPKPIHELSGVRVLVMERFIGFRIDDTAGLATMEGDFEAKLLLGMRAWFRCLLVHGFFHGDVHAGNLMVLGDGRVGFLDFGIVGRFEGNRHRLVSDFLVATATRNFLALARAMIEMGHMEKVDEKALAKDLERECAPLLDPSRPAKYADLLPVITRAVIRHRMRMPRDFVLILKQMIYFDRYAKLLAPKLNIFADPRIIASLMEDLQLARQNSMRPAAA
jgi:predicted unusual protein kinase regulating ubiquinone biosynthesis (AarF/ABC1/UbiB family)